MSRVEDNWEENFTLNGNEGEEEEEKAVQESENADSNKNYKWKVFEEFKEAGVGREVGDKSNKSLLGGLLGGLLDSDESDSEEEYEKPNRDTYDESTAKDMGIGEEFSGFEEISMDFEGGNIGKEIRNVADSVGKIKVDDSSLDKQKLKEVEEVQNNEMAVDVFNSWLDGGITGRLGTDKLDSNNNGAEGVYKPQNPHPLSIEDRNIGIGGAENGEKQLVEIIIDGAKDREEARKKTKKLSKKAIEEMRKETERILRSSSINIEPKVDKKDINWFLARLRNRNKIVKEKSILGSQKNISDIGSTGVDNGNNASNAMEDEDYMELEITNSSIKVKKEFKSINTSEEKVKTIEVAKKDNVELARTGDDKKMTQKHAGGEKINSMDEILTRGIDGPKGMKKLSKILWEAVMTQHSQTEQGDVRGNDDEKKGKEEEDDVDNDMEENLEGSKNKQSSEGNEEEEEKEEEEEEEEDAEEEKDEEGGEGEMMDMDTQDSMLFTPQHHKSTKGGFDEFKDDENYKSLIDDEASDSEEEEEQEQEEEEEDEGREGVSAGDDNENDDDDDDDDEESVKISIRRRVGGNSQSRKDGEEVATIPTQMLEDTPEDNIPSMVFRELEEGESRRKGGRLVKRKEVAGREKKEKVKRSKFVEQEAELGSESSGDEGEKEIEKEVHMDGIMGQRFGRVQTEKERFEDEEVDKYYEGLEEDEEDRLLREDEMIDHDDKGKAGVQGENTKERIELAKKHLEYDVEKDDKQVRKLIDDLTSGRMAKAGTRDQRMRGQYITEYSADNDEDYNTRQTRVERMMARRGLKQRLAKQEIKDSNLNKMAKNPKNKAFVDAVMFNHSISGFYEDDDD